MTTIYLIKNKDDYRSLMVDLADEGCRWNSGEEMTGVPYHERAEVIYKKGKTVTEGREKYFIENYIKGTLKKEFKVVHYTAKPENLFYTFQELLEFDWSNDWRIILKHPGLQFLLKRKYYTLDRLLSDIGDIFEPEDIVRILKEGRFYLEKVE